MRPALALSVSSALLTSAALSAEPTRLLRQPDIDAVHVVFCYGGDVWVAGRDGGDARRLTSYPGVESDPCLSPDGSLVAFSGAYDGNTDVYVVPVAGGEPRRLTWHPGEDAVRGWTADGTAVIFASGRTSAPIAYPKLWSVPLAGGAPSPLPVPRAWRGSFSPDGKRLAYQMIEPWETEWRNYRGGQAGPIRIIDLATAAESKLPWDGANDNSPVWLDGSVYFLSDRDLAMNVWSYDLTAAKLTQLTHFKDFDAKSLNGGAGMLVFEQAGYLHALDPRSRALRRLEITAAGDFPWARPHWEKVEKALANPALSPSGKRAAFEARGEILTVPAEKGDARNLTASPAAADRSPAWSPDGQKLAWFSDESGEYRLIIADQNGENRTVVATENPTFFYSPAWSPDSKRIAFTDANRDLWVCEVATKALRRVDNEMFAHPDRVIYPAWSPDSKWVAYTKRLPNQYAAIFLYSIASGAVTQVTDGMSDSRSPAWDAGGKYLYFLASTDYALNVGWLDMTSYDRPTTRAIYLAVLAKDVPSPLLPESDEEKKDEKGKDGKDEKAAENGKDKKAMDPKDAKKEAGKEGEEKKEVVVTIDLDGLAHRIVALDVPARDYQQLAAGAEGTVFYSEAIVNQKGLTLHRYTLEKRKAADVTSGLTGFALSADGKKLLYGTQDNAWAIVDAASEPKPGEPKPGDGKLATSELRVKVDPQLEWRQIFREAVRFQRDYFYVKNVHGLDLSWVERTYGPWVEHVRHRDDLTYVLDILGGETAIGHSFTGGGDMPDVDAVPVGLLGADLAADSGRYRIARIYTGESWNPTLRAPLAAPGVDVREGDYVIAVNGRELTAAMNPYTLFDRTADTQTRLRVNAKPTAEGARDVVVVPVASENALRRYDWIEANRRRVDELSGGKLAYLWLPNTGQGGYANFNRYYFAQAHKQGAVVDERYNGGGSIADYMVDIMARDLLGYFNNPLGDKQPFTAPNAAIWGPKVMIINDAAGSGGDMLPFMFRLKKIGPLVGTRTWGGLVGIWDVPDLIDGGYITAPRGGFYNLAGEWDVEGKGVAPDVEVEMEPRLVNAGHDPQLERAVEVALGLLPEKGVKLLPQPPDPVRVARPR
jgi:tricorn protease